MYKRTLLQRRKCGTYYFRKKIPLQLRSLIGKTEIVKSLGTNKYQEAILLTVSIEKDILTQFNQLQVKKDNQLNFEKPNEIIEVKMNQKSVVEVSNNKMKVSEIIEAIFRRKKISESTIKEYNKLSKQLIELYGDVTIDSFNKSHIHNFIEILKLIGKTPKTEQYASKTIKELECQHFCGQFFRKVCQQSLNLSFLYNVNSATCLQFII